MLDAATFQPVALPHQAVAQPHFAPTLSGSRPVWCVVAAKPKAERTAHAELHRRGFEAYLPLLTVRLPNRHYRTGPLFPGYLFVKMDLAKPWNPVRLCPGVFSLLFTDGKPGTVADAEIRLLQASEALRASPLPADGYWAPGMACRLGKGHPIEGVDAVVTEVREDIAILALMMFGRINTVSVPVKWLKARDE
jgi:transcriptional antiterminator RfaH